MHGWSYTSRQWQPYHQAQAAYHAQDYPAGKMTELAADNKGYKKVAGVIDQALGDLARYLNGIPYTVTVDGLATRRLWEGLHNNKQGQPGKPGTTWLPGHTLPLGQQPDRRHPASTRTPARSRGQSASRALALTTR